MGREAAGIGGSASSVIIPRSMPGIWQGNYQPCPQRRKRPGWSRDTARRAFSAHPAAGGTAAPRERKVRSMPEFQVRLLCTYEVHTTLTVTAESAAAAKAHVEQLLREGESPQLFTRESSGVITGVD